MPSRPHLWKKELTDRKSNPIYIPGNALRVVFRTFLLFAVQQVGIYETLYVCNIVWASVQTELYCFYEWEQIIAHMDSFWFNSHIPYSISASCAFDKTRAPASFINY